MKTLVEEHIKESNKDSHFIPRMIAMAVFAAVFAYAFATLVLNVETKTLSYKQSGVADYEVCLKENSYFTDPCQPAGKQYIASLINNVKTHFRYSFKAAEDVDYQYRYDITAKVVATDGDNAEKVLYESEEILMTGKEIAKVGGEFMIVEDADINYDKYNGLITKFRSDYGLTLKANVVVALNVHLLAKADGFSRPIQSDEKVALNIPLSERTINVSLSSDEVKNNGNLEEKVRDPSQSLPWIITAIVSGTVALSILIISIIIFVMRELRRSDYEKELKQITREYSQLIVDVEHVPEIPRSKIIEVKSFDELLDARDTIQQPILHLTAAENRSLFIIEDQGMAYVYSLSDKTLARRSAKKTEVKNN
jgi:hypothetical protein